MNSYETARFGYSNIPTTFQCHILTQQFTFITVKLQLCQLMYHIKSHKDQTRMLPEVRFDRCFSTQHRGQNMFPDDIYIYAFNFGKTVARSLYYMKPQISLAWITRFFKIWGYMKALNLLFHCRYDSQLCSGK